MIAYQKGVPFVVDLEWIPETNRTTVVGVAYSDRESYATYDVAHGMAVVRRHMEDGTQLMGHNCVEADVPRIGAPKSYRPEHVFDTKIVAHLIHAHFAEMGLLDLGSLVRFYRPTTEWKSDKADLLTYNGYDTAYNYGLAIALKQDLIITGQEHLVEKQQRLAHMAYLMQQRGIKLDTEGLFKYAKEREIDKAEQKLSFGNLKNPNSNPQIIEWLASEHRISVRDCQYETLAKLQGRHVDIDRLITYRDDNKALSTWFPFEYEGKGRKRSIADVGNMAFPHFNVTGTAVARFSCADPNYQNLPPHLRRYLIPPEDHDFWKFDAKQLENRTVAWHAGDWDALELWKTYDPYRMTAAVMFGCRYEDVTESQRAQAKTTELASIYGETHYNLANRLFKNQKKTSLVEAKHLQDLYFSRRPKVKQWQDGLAKRFDSGDISFHNPFGRFRCVYAPVAHEFKKRAAHYQGCSSGADHINGRALDIERELGLLPGLLVHDEWAGWLPKGDVGLKLARQIKLILERPIPEMPLPDGSGLIVPVKAKRGSNYGEMEEVVL